MENNEVRPIRIIGFEIKRLFEEVIRTFDEQPDNSKMEKGRLVEEADRFRVWAINMGLFVVGHGSLDYRALQSQRGVRKITLHLRAPIAEYQRQNGQTNPI
ncbi:hypothetical protein ABW20_dc0108346 [Dactylellina cionopaga]|nr:hypothetical protein ABW20_dc0108346 [Dactylellina cionopaga]